MEYGEIKQKGNKTSIRISNTFDTASLHFDLTEGQIYNASSNSVDAGNAFDNFNSNWVATSEANEWISIQFETSKIIKQILIRAGGTNIGDLPYGAKHCKLEGSNNGSTWTKVPAISAIRATIVNIDEFECSQESDFDIIYFSNTTTYLYYRIYVFDNYGGVGALLINEIQMLDTLVASGTLRIQHNLDLDSPYLSFLSMVDNNGSQVDTSSRQNTANYIDILLAESPIEGTWAYLLIA